MLPFGGTEHAVTHCSSEHCAPPTVSELHTRPPQADAYADDTVLTEVMKLPAKLREVILLRYYQELTIRETADALHLATATIKERQRKANALLHSRLKEWYFDE